MLINYYQVSIAYLALFMTSAKKEARLKNEVFGGNKAKEVRTKKGIEGEQENGGND